MAEENESRRYHMESANRLGGVHEEDTAAWLRHPIHLATCVRQVRVRAQRDLIGFAVYSSPSVIPLLLTRGGALPDEYAA
jgi:hypothetical protein